MRILIVHNHYQQPGGEDAVVRDEYGLLKEFGEDVHLYERDNSELKNLLSLKTWKLLFAQGWSEDSYHALRAKIRAIRPDVVHFHNVFYVLTPSVYQACRDEGVPVVESLHNFRLLCSNALLFRDNKICEECIEQKTLDCGIRHKCFKGSRFLTRAAVRMMERYWQKGVWTDMVDHYIMASQFGRRKHIDAGIPSGKISVKPHVVHPDSSKVNRDEGYALYVGRLSGEKGVHILLQAYKKFSALPLKIAGSGPLADEFKAYVHDNRIPNVEFLGFISDEEYHRQMAGAKFLIVPSVCYENFPRIVVEAYSYGIPVLASSLGSFPEIVLEKRTGVLFDPGSSDDLAKKIQCLTEHAAELAAMRENVRKEYKEKYSSRKNYEILMEVYKKATGRIPKDSIIPKSVFS